MHVIVTGGSSGIGLEVARQYLRSGAKVSIIARNARRLDEARQDLERSVAAGVGRIGLVSADVAVEAEISSAISACELTFGPCDILVASAGIVEPGLFDEQSSAVFAGQIDTNLLGTINSVRAVYSGMKIRRSGKIMIISSGAALIGIHGYSAYCASKSALVGFAEALQAEARSFGIQVAICFPPDTLTPQFEQELPKRSPEARRLMGAAAAWPADAVAAKIVSAIDRGRSKTFFGFSLTALGWIGPLLKPALLWWFGRETKR
ncbi:SDR family NAD(P)-dependent oxidoreductase [Neorhizobium lilium]|uniref:3-dehydrosphinganine reductase n=1 Tax=Neorhizobium lilium TaxID=2503024 RepID=A0A444LDB8_9HYPH|nr:SDR family oxidoreductase [Neorhizobium lilium]RWX75765.1 SDR family NAD(P)-dependent oxidoreductase [Neorhizobium lilium]